MCNVAPALAAHTQAPEPVPAEDFAQRLIDTLNGGATALMLSLGHRTGLFDCMAELPPATSQGIARAAGLNERYVREWLGAMVAARIVELDPAAGLYRLPPERAACLTRRSAPDNIAVFAQYIPLLAQVEDDILGCFHKGGGVPYERYGRFHEVMAEDSAQTVVAALHEHILPLVPGLLRRLESGSDVLDVGCGSGRALIAMADAYPNSRFTGYDLSAEAVERARAEAQRLGLANVLFETRDVTALAETGAYDLITAFDAVHDQKRPGRVLAAIAQALRADGTFLMQDIAGSSHHHEDRDHPIGPFLYTISCMHCMSVSLAQGGDGLGAMWGREKALEMLGAAGFGQVDVHRLDHDFQNFFYVARAGAV
jgi:2-polyprenyl-3-methyl-5-hydroxy-6-metoxy-1,4-benzoquinol methylase